MSDSSRSRRLLWTLATTGLVAVMLAAPATAQESAPVQEPSDWSPVISQIDDTAAALRGAAVIATLGGDEVFALGGDEVFPIVTWWAMPEAPFTGGAAVRSGDHAELDWFVPDVDDEVLVELRGFMDQTNPLAELRQALAAQGQRVGLHEERSGITGVAEVMLASEDARDLVERLGSSPVSVVPASPAANEVWKAPAGVETRVSDSHDRYSNQEVLFLAWIQSEVAAVLDDWVREQRDGPGVDLDVLARAVAGWPDVRDRHRDLFDDIGALTGTTVLDRVAEPVEPRTSEPSRTTTTSEPSRTTTTSEPSRTTTTTGR